ncbi:MAG: hypothetical protein WCJ72_04970 [Chryseobacterium sp.]
MKTKKKLRKKFHFKLRMRNAHFQLKKAMTVGKAKDMENAGKLLSKINQLIVKEFSSEQTAQPKILKL